MDEKGRKGLESRRRLMEVAAAEFAREGFHKTKISTIVQKAGLTQPSFYIYFSNKEAIFDELIEGFYSRLKTLTQSFRLESNIRSEDLSIRLTEVIEKLFLFLNHDPDLARIGFHLHPKSAELKAELTKVLKQNLEAEQYLGYFRAELDMQVAAECLSVVIEQLYFGYIVLKKKDIKDLAAQVVNLFMQGMLVESGKNN